MFEKRDIFKVKKRFRILMIEAKIYNYDRCSISGQVAFLISCHRMFGSVGKHRGVYISSKNYHDILEEACGDVREALNKLNIRDTEVVPFYAGRDKLDEVVKANRWNGLVVIDLDGYLTNFIPKES